MGLAIGDFSLHANRALQPFCAVRTDLMSRATRENDSIYYLAGSKDCGLNGEKSEFFLIDSEPEIRIVPAMASSVMCLPILVCMHQETRDRVVNHGYDLCLPSLKFLEQS